MRRPRHGWQRGQVARFVRDILDHDHLAGQRLELQLLLLHALDEEGERAAREGAAALERTLARAQPPALPASVAVCGPHAWLAVMAGWLARWLAG